MLPKPNRHYNTDVVPFATKIELNNEVVSVIYTFIV